MFVSIRKYHNVKSVEEVRRRAELEFVPLLKGSGFQGYYLIDCDSPESGNYRDILSMFDSWDSALASNEIAKTFVRKRLADMLPEPADAAGGE